MSELDALQDCLAAEHAAVYGYGTLGGTLAGMSGTLDEEALAATWYAAHRERRDLLADVISGLEAEPVPAEPAYRTPALASPADCRRLAVELEQRCASVYAYAVSQTADDDRRFTAETLAECALAAAAWGGRPDPLPGIDDL